MLEALKKWFKRPDPNRIPGATRGRLYADPGLGGNTIEKRRSPQAKLTKITVTRADGRVEVYNGKGEPDVHG